MADGVPPQGYDFTKEIANHASHRIGWLRAAVLGANDGILSTASLIIGVAASAASQREILTAGIAGLVAGAMSMAAGEYVSVSSQADTEAADLAVEAAQLKAKPHYEHAELADIYVRRGLTPELAQEVAHQLEAHDALDAHRRDELGITDISAARPVQAAFTSAVTFGTGAAMPLIAALLSPLNYTSVAVGVASLVFLAILGAIGARAGRASVVRGMVRVLFWGALAMAVTYGIGKLFGTTIA